MKKSNRKLLHLYKFFQVFEINRTNGFFILIDFQRIRTDKFCDSETLKLTNQPMTLLTKLLRFIHNWSTMGIRWMVCWCVLVHSGQILSHPSSYLHKSLSHGGLQVCMLQISGNSNPELYIGIEPKKCQRLKSLLPNLDKECLWMSLSMNMLSTFCVCLKSIGF